MKRLFAAAALAAAVVPATAGAVPPDTTGGPLGANACAVVATPALPGRCNFTGASGGVGYGGISTEGFSLTHVRIVNICATRADGSFRVDRQEAQTAVDESGGAGEGGFGPVDFEDGPDYSFVTGRVYTFTVKGVGFGAAGGQSGPATAEPATPTVANRTGAEDTTNGKQVGDLC